MRPETSHPTSRGSFGRPVITVAHSGVTAHLPAGHRGSRGRRGEGPAAWKPLQPPPHRSPVSGPLHQQWEGCRRVLRETLHPQRNPLQRLLGSISRVCACVHPRGGHASCLHLLMEDSRPSPGSAVNGFYKQLLIKKRLSSKQLMFLKELMHFPMRTVLFNVNP